jgi:hypothetical protein
MRPPRVLLRSCVCAIGVLLLGSVAFAGPTRVVVMGTDGPKGWAAAERRLIAELGAMGVDVVALPDREGADRELPQYARDYGALAAVQVLRRGDNGVIRIWARGVGDQPGEFRHRSVNLRNPDVVSLAVLPVVEFVFDRVEEIPAPKLRSAPATNAQPSQPARLPPPSEAEAEPGGSSRPVLPDEWAKRLGAPVFGPPVVYHVRSDMRYATRLGGGPWFSGGNTTPAVNVVLGLRAHWVRLLAVEAEAFVQPIAHRIDAIGGVGTLRLFGVRAHALYEPWPRSDVHLGIGPGAGLYLLDAALPYESAAGRNGAFVSLRAQIASALMPFFDVVFAFSANRSLVRVAGYSLRAPDAALMRNGLDSMIAIDWHWQ